VTGTKLPIKITRSAAAQIRDGASWWSANRPKAPGAFAEDLRRAVELISHQPTIGTRAAIRSETRRAKRIVSPRGKRAERARNGVRASAPIKEERETGFEPATSTLANWRSVGNKRLQRPSHSILVQFSSKSTTLPRPSASVNSIAPSLGQGPTPRLFQSPTPRGDFTAHFGPATRRRGVRRANFVAGCDSSTSSY
jgi:plasmid stabilization system protein ParE